MRAGPSSNGKTELTKIPRKDPLPRKENGKNNVQNPQAKAIPTKSSDTQLDSYSITAKDVELWDAIHNSIIQRMENVFSVGGVVAGKTIYKLVAPQILKTQ